jgi:tRNA(Ile)-lysidine synthase
MRAPLEAGTRPPELSPEAAISEFLQALRRPTRLLVAVSGGSDSTGLLVTLAETLRSHPLPHTLCAATVDHGLRPTSAAEALEVSALCDGLGIPHQILRWTGQKPATGLSEAARLARYRLLSQAAASAKADAIVTGHTLDDQIETVIMRSSRSNGDALGLTGMAPATLYDRALWILRPFLQTRRQAIRRLLSEQDISWIDDPSNEDPRYERVRIRRSLPDIDPATLSEAAVRRQALSRQSADWLAACASSAPGPVAILSLSAGAHQPVEARDHALAALVTSVGGRAHRPAATSLKRLAAALDTRTDFRLTLSGTLVVCRRDRLYLVRERRGFLPLFLAPREIGVWDGRYTVVNESDAEITVCAGPAREGSTDLPGSVRAALAGSAPQATGNTAFSGAARATVIIRPRLSLYADFMPLFEQPLADAIASLLGTEPSPPCPI